MAGLLFAFQNVDRRTGLTLAAEAVILCGPSEPRHLDHRAPRSAMGQGRGLAADPVSVLLSSDLTDRAARAISPDNGRGSAAS